MIANRELTKMIAHYHLIAATSKSRKFFIISFASSSILNDRARFAVQFLVHLFS